MAEDGIVGDYNGSKARDVLLTMAKWNAMQGIEPDEGDDENGVENGTSSIAGEASETSDAYEEEYEDVDGDEYEDYDEEEEEYEDETV